MVAYFDVLPLYTLGMRSVNEFLSKNYTSFGYTFPVFASIVQTLSTVYRIVFIYKAVLVRQKNIATGTVPMTMQSYEVAANSMFACFTDLYTALPYCRVSEQFHLVFPWG